LTRAIRSDSMAVIVDNSDMERYAHMSLTVSPDLLSKAQRGPVSDTDFVDCIRRSLPYAWSVVSAVAEKLHTTGGAFADNQTPPPDADARGELLRLVASDAMRSAVERCYGVRIAFQNCHRLALFNPDAQEAYDEFVTPRAQLLNQRPEFVNC
jgi:hypothetical protein